MPVFVTDKGEVLAESAAILRWADTQVAPERRLYPQGDLGTEAAALEASMDDGLGPDGRLWMYHETLPVVHEMTNVPKLLMKVPPNRIHAAGGSDRRLSRKDCKGG